MGAGKDYEDTVEVVFRQRVLDGFPKQSIPKILIGSRL
jgi:hypothetical protein